jgi:hypothetical protein
MRIKTRNDSIAKRIQTENAGIALGEGVLTQ